MKMWKQRVKSVFLTMALVLVTTLGIGFTALAAD